MEGSWIGPTFKLISGDDTLGSVTVLADGRYLARTKGYMHNDHWVVPYIDRHCATLEDAKAWVEAQWSEVSKVTNHYYERD